eukprot:7964576-Ditylum_brightwellii.AAC.1
MPSRIRDIVEVAHCNDDDNGATDWNKTMKKRLQGRQQKDGSITDFFQRKRGHKRKFDRERQQVVQQFTKKTSVTTETVMRAKKQGGQWMAVTIRSIVKNCGACTEK